MNFGELVEAGVKESFESIDTNLIFESIDTSTGSFLRLSAREEEGVAWFIVTYQGFLRVSDEHKVVLEGKYQEFVKER